MLWSIIETKRGDDRTIFTNTRANCNNRIKQLRDSSVPGAKYRMVEAEAGAVKFDTPRNKDRSH